MALAERTDYRFVHNHVTVDVAKLVFSHKTPQNRQLFSDLKDALRLDVIRYAAQADISMITTLAYTAHESDGFVRDVINTVTDAGGEVCFVRLYAPRKSLYERLGSESRLALGKTTDRMALDRKFEKGGLDERISFVESLELNTAELAPEQSVQRIIDRFAL